MTKAASADATRTSRVAAATTAAGVPVTVVCATNDAFVLSAAAMLHSVAVHLPVSTSLRVFILDDGVSTFCKERLERVASRFPVCTTLTWLTATTAVLDDAQLTSSTSRAHFLRILIGSLLPADVKRVVYLDTDIVVRSDLSPLWVTSLAGCPAGAVQNHLPSRVGDTAGVAGYGALGIAPSEPYFNSGLLLIDLPEWRQARVEAQALDYVRTYPNQLHYGDQDALNAALAGRWLPLPPEWNVIATIYWLQSWPDSPLKREIEAREWELLHAPRIIHFAGKTKPWMPGCSHPLRLLYLHHVRASGWDAADSRV